MTTEVPSSGDAGHGRGTVGAPAWASLRTSVSAVARPRLLLRLDRTEQVAVIRAAPGYGRTVLASQWAARQRTAGWAVVWPSPPWTSDAWTVVRDAVVAALRTAGRSPDVSAEVTPAELGALVDAAAVPVLLVLDDVDGLDDEAAVADVAALLAASRSLRTLLVAGARYPLLATGAQHPVLSAATGRLHVQTLTARDLAFTPTELQQAAATWGHMLDDARLRRLVALVDGWPVLARAVLDDTRPDDVELATAGAYAFLRDVILASVGDTALLTTAMIVAATGDPTPEAVTVALAAAGREVPGGDTVNLLLRLEAVGMLRRRPADGGPSAWQAPALLQEVMRRELERHQPELSGTVHRALARAALRAHPPDPRGAVDHASRAHDWTLLEVCWLDFGTFLAATGGPAVDAAYLAVPDDVAEGSSVLSLARATARRPAEQRADTRGLVMRLLTELGGPALDGAWRSRTAAGRWMGASAAMVAARAQGDMRRAMTIMRDTEVAAARAGLGGESSGRSYWWFLVQAGRTVLLEGDTGTALELATRAYELADPYRAPDVRAAAAGHVALAHATDGALVETDRWLVRYVEALDPVWEDLVRDHAADVAEAMLATDQLDPGALDAALSRIDVDLRGADVTWPFVLRVRVRRAVLFGDPEAGLAEIEQVERTRHAWLERATAVHRAVLRMRAELLLALGEFHRVADLLEECDPGAVWCDVPRARWLLLTGDPHTALRVAVQGGRRRGVNLADRTDLLVLEAWAAHALGQGAEAVRAFRSARRLAGEQCALRSFAHLPAAVRDALADAAERPFDDDERARLAATGEVLPDPAELVPLTPRERVVLSLLDEHPTTRDVADALTVSVNTVRKQVLSIYAKLGVHDREAALRRAHELGVLRAHPPSR